MIPTMLAIALGLGLVIPLWYLTQRAPAPRSPLEEPGASLLPSAEVLAALFNPGDREFVVTRKSPELLAMLEAQRKSIALSWLAAVRREAILSIREYNGSVRARAQVDLLAEFRILWQILAFVCLHYILEGLVRTLGAFRVRGLLQQMHVLSETLLKCAQVTAADRAH